MKTQIGIGRTLAAALAVAICLGTPADAGSKGGSRSGGGSSFSRRSGASLVRTPIARNLPRKIQRTPRIGGIQAERSSALRGTTRIDAGTRITQTGSKVRTERLRNVGTRLEGNLRTDNLKSGEATSRLRMQPGIVTSRNAQVSNWGDEAVKAGTAGAAATSGFLSTAGGAAGGVLAKVATAGVGTVAGAATGAELAVAGGAVSGAAAAGLGAGYAIHKGYEAVAGETIGDSGPRRSTTRRATARPRRPPPMAAPRAPSASGSAKRSRTARRRRAGTRPATARAPRRATTATARPTPSDDGSDDSGDDAAADDGQSTDSGCDPGEQSCDQGSDDGGDDDSGADDGQTSADGSSTPNPDAADSNRVSIHERTGGRLGGEEQARQKGGLDTRRGGGHTDPTEEGGSGSFVGSTGSFVRGQKGREQKLVDQGIAAGNGSHAGADKERKHAFVPEAQELQDLKVRSGGDVSNPPQGGDDTSGGAAGGIAPGAPVQAVSGVRAVSGARLSQAVSSGRVRVNVQTH